MYTSKYCSSEFPLYWKSNIWLIDLLMCLVLKNQNNNMAMGHIENGSAELQDKLEPLD